MGQRGAGRSLRQIKVDRKHVFVLPLTMAPTGHKLMAPPSPLPTGTPEPPATDCDSRGQTRCSDLSRHFDLHCAPGSFCPLQHVVAVTAVIQKA